MCVCVEKHREQCKTFVVAEKTTTTTHKFDQRCDVVVSLPMFACMCVSLLLQLQLQTQLQFVAGHEFNVVEWGGAKSLERPNSLECHCETVYTLPFSFNKLIHKLSTAATAT